MHPLLSKNDWAALAAAVAAILILAAGIAAGLVGGTAAEVIAGERGPGIAETLQRVLSLASMQAAIVTLVMLHAARWGGRPADLLGLHAPKPGDVGRALIGMAAILVPYNAVVYWLARDAMLEDVAVIRGLLDTPLWWAVAIVVVAGAPLAEELLFRGFLLPILAESRLGLAGAMAATSVAWSALHWGYSTASMIEVFVIGLYLAWMRWATRSLLVPLACHATYNAAVLLVLLLL